MTRTVLNVYVLVAVCCLAACAGSIPAFTPAALQRARTQWPGIGSEDLEAGRAAYVLKCSGCHSLVAPGAKTAGEWKRDLIEMGTRAKLTMEESERVYQYLFANAKEE